MASNEDIKKLVVRVFGTDEGKLLLDHLYKRNVHTSVANTSDLLDIGKRQGRADLVRSFYDLIHGDK